jgi:hypothetical protein
MKRRTANPNGQCQDGFRIWCLQITPFPIEIWNKWSMSDLLLVMIMVTVMMITTNAFIRAWHVSRDTRRFSYCGPLGFNPKLLPLTQSTWQSMSADRRPFVGVWRWSKKAPNWKR